MKLLPACLWRRRPCHYAPLSRQSDTSPALPFALFGTSSRIFLADFPTLAARRRAARLLAVAGYRLAAQFGRAALIPAFEKALLSRAQFLLLRAIWPHT